MASGSEADPIVTIPPNLLQTGTGHILDLSDEILLKIVSYLGQPQTNAEHNINLSQSCIRFDNLLQDASFCRRINVPWNTFIKRSNLFKYLTQPVRTELISELNFNDLYWISSREINHLVLKLGNLTGLHVLGTLLNFEDLLDILLKLSLSDLSWTWKIGRLTDEENYDFFKSDALSEKLSQLQKLCLFIPPVFQIADQQHPPFLSFCYFLFLCQGLEKLWIFTCDRGDPELVSVSLQHLSDSVKDFLAEIEYPNLTDFVYSFPEMTPGPELKLYVPKLVSKILQGFTKSQIFEAENEQEKSTALIPVHKIPKQLWLDHPMLEKHCKTANPDNFNRAGWPQMDLNFLESISFPVFFEVLNGLFPNNVVPDLSKCKHLQICHFSEGSVPLLDRYLDSAVNLESFVCKDPKFQMDWNVFVKLHQKLTLVNVCMGLNLDLFPTHYAGLSNLTKLKQISVSTTVLRETSDAELIREYRILAGSLEAGSSYSTTQPTGLDFLTSGCRDVEEFEIGLDHLVQSEYSSYNLNSLGSISLWKNLRKLTLILRGIVRFGFMIQIAKYCPLESLRLTMKEEQEEKEGKQLCFALSFCEHLKDFRLEYPYIGDHIPIFLALECCTKLERLVIISNSIGLYRPFTIATTHVMEMIKSCTKLSTLYLFFGSANRAACISLQLEIETMFKDSRPPLSIAICDSALYKFEFPAIHYRQLVVLSSQVGPLYDYPDKFVSNII